MRQLQDELALESVTNIEFEEASRRSFDNLNGQVQILKGAFNKLTDGLLEELDLMGGKVDQQLQQIASKKIGVEGALVKELAEATKRQDSLSSDVDAILGVIPKLEDKVDSVLGEINRVNHTMNELRANTDFQRLETQVQQLELDIEQRHRRLESELKEDVEERLLKVQRSTNRQLESMSKVLAEPGSSPMRRTVDFDIPGSPTFSTAAPAASMLSPAGRLSRSHSPAASRSFGRGDISASLRDAGVGSRLSGLRV